MRLPLAAGRGFGRFYALDEEFDLPAMAAGLQDGNRGNLAQIDAILAADVRGGDSVTRDIHPAHIVRSGKIGIASGCFATNDSAVFLISRPGVRAW